MRKTVVNSAEGPKESEGLDIDKISPDLLDQTSEDALNFFKEHMYEIALEENIETDVFLAHQEQIWGKCFAASQAMYVMAVESADLYSKYVQENVEESVRSAKQYTYLSLQHIHGRACQEFLEILCLMRNGFADCAYARWRSMYELYCTGKFIIKQGEQIAKQYYLQSVSDDIPSLSGQSFKWTEGAIDKSGNVIKYCSSKKIQEYCECDKTWERQYKLACIVNHASPEGTFKRLSNGKQTNVIPVGSSDYGITTPAEHSAITLQQITTLFLSIFPSKDGSNRCKLLYDWVNVVQEMYFATHDQVFNALHTTAHV